jgi:hypothetical protein
MDNSSVACNIANGSLLCYNTGKEAEHGHIGIVLYNTFGQKLEEFVA